MKLALLLAVAFAGVAEAVEITAAGRIFVSTGAEFETKTETVSDYPLAVEPVYWLDASDSDDWEFDNAGGIVKIPSRSASSRYLTSQSDEIAYTNYSQNLWWSGVTASKLKKPTLAAADHGLKGPYIDFGPSFSWKTLYFNPIKPTADCTPSNILSGVGTVVGVYRSYNGGGNILGGSQFRRFTNAKQCGTNFTEAVVATGNGNDFITSGTFWSGLQKSVPSSTFWSGDWQVIALNPSSANITTHGLCGNCEHHDEIYSSGDQGIAELMIFDRILTDADITHLVVYLEKKWLGVSSAGYNGNASLAWLEIGGAKPPHGKHAANYPQDGTDIHVTVAAGDELTIDRLTGGRSTAERKHRLVKQGPGTIRLNDASTFGGSIALNEGSLALGGRTIPALADLAPGLCLRFDPSQASTLTLDGENIVAISNLGDSGRWPVEARQDTASLRPKLAANAPRSGLKLIDFNDATAAGGKYLKFNTAAAPQIGTVVMVVDSSTYTGAHFLNAMFTMRCNNNGRYSTSDQWNGIRALFFPQTLTDVNAKYDSFQPLTCGNAWANGRKLSHETEAYETPGLNVIALRAPAAGIHGLGGYSESNCGGLRIGEVLGWNGELSETQIRDAQAYLMNKWLKRTAPGYRPEVDRNVAEIQTVEAATGTAIHIPEGETATVRRLSAEGRVLKTGAGTLRIGESGNTELNLIVAEGTVARADAADPNGNQEIAAEPSLHFDPSAEWSVRKRTYNGTNFVWTLMDSRGLVSATEMMQDWELDKRPFIDDEKCNGLATVNFGPMICGFNANEGAYLKLSRNITNVRSVYFILGSQEGGGNPLGCHSTFMTLGCGPDGAGELGGRRLDFHRGYTDGNDALKTMALFNSAAPAVKAGELYIDGVKKNVSEYIPNGSYELVELHISAGCQFNAIGNGFESYVHGGFRLGEMIVFERELTERERTATRNFLLKKWRGKTDDELAALPEKPVAAPIGYAFAELSADFLSGGRDIPDAVIGIPSGVKINIKNLPELAEGQMTLILSAAGFEGANNLRSAVFTGETIPNGGKISLRIINNSLYAKYVSRSLNIIIR